MRDQNTETIRAACIKANPEKNWKWQASLDPEPFSLADVLLAIPKRAIDRLEASANYFYIREVGRGGSEGWNLRQDDLTLQSDECVAFLANLLQ
jgi:hypothetical protein